MREADLKFTKTCFGILKLTCEFRQVLNRGGFPSSRFPNEKNGLPPADTNSQLFQQDSRGTSSSKCLAVPVHSN